MAFRKNPKQYIVAEEVATAHINIYLGVVEIKQTDVQLQSSALQPHVTFCLKA